MFQEPDIEKSKERIAKGIVQTSWELSNEGPLFTEDIPSGISYVGTYPNLIRSAKRGLIYSLPSGQELTFEIPEYCSGNLVSFVKIDANNSTIVCEFGAALDDFKRSATDIGTVAVYHYKIGADGLKMGPRLAYKGKGVFQGASIADSRLVLFSSYGTMQTFTLFDDQLTDFQTVQLPEHLTIKDIKSRTKNESIELDCESEISISQKIIYNYVQKAWIGADSARHELIANDVAYMQKIIEIPARDGVLIPVRLLYRKDAPPSRASAGLIQVYGAFGEVYLYPKFSDNP